jgi:long-chain acyl-CoA synthetase
VEPDPIENVARQSPLVNQIIVVGQDQKALGALVVPNAAPLATALGKPDNTPLEDLCADPSSAKKVRDSIGKLITGSGEFKSFEQVTRVALITEPFSESNGLMTQTLKPKRNVIADRYKETIAALFS